MWKEKNPSINGKSKKPLIVSALAAAFATATYHNWIIYKIIETMKEIVAEIVFLLCQLRRLIWIRKFPTPQSQHHSQLNTTQTIKNVLENVYFKKFYIAKRNNICQHCCFLWKKKKWKVEKNGEFLIFPIKTKEK